MAKRRRRRRKVNFGAPFDVHTTRAGEKLREVQGILHDLHFSQGPISCEHIDTQLSVADNMMGMISGDVRAISHGSAPHLVEAQERA